MSSALLDSLERHARQRPGVLALRDDDGRSLDWAGLRDAVAALAGRLRAAAGASPVMIVSSNRAELLVGILAALRADAAVLPVAPDAPPAQLADLARRAGARVLIAEPAILDALADDVATAIPLDSVDLQPAASNPGPGASGGGAILLESSGTTGLPKLVRRDADALDAVGESTRRAVGVGEADVMLLAIPLYHSFGIDQAALMAVTAGCRIELQRRFEPARAAAALVEREVTLLPGVPLMFDALARTAGRAPALRRACSAGSPLPRRVFDAFQAAFGIPIGQLYGTTEFGSVTFNDPDRPGFDPAAVGRPMDGVEIRIVDADAVEPTAALPPGREGQVAVSAASMLSAYLDGVLSLRDGFLLTGDLGLLDPDGVLRLTGRAKLLIDIGGLKVNPLEIEALLAGHPAVREAVVVPLAYSDTASRLKAVVVPEEGCHASGTELRAFLRERLIHYKVPRVFEITRSVPRSPTGKILRQQLVSAPAARSGS